MTIYVSKLWIQCDHDTKDDYRDCDEDVETRPEVGNGCWFEGGGSVDHEGLVNELNGEFEQLSCDWDHLHGWTAFVERNSNNFKVVKVYCPKHASIKILEKESKVVPEEKEMLYKKYKVGDFEYFYSRSQNWYAYEIDKETVDYVDEDSIGACASKSQCLHMISWKQASLDNLRYETGLKDATSETCKDKVKEVA